MAATDLIIGLISGACGSLVLWVTIGRRMMLKYAGQSVINALKDPSEDTIEAVNGLFSVFWESANRPQIEVGKDDNGNRILITPIQAVVAAAGDAVMHRLRGLQGSIARGAQSVEAAALGIALPRKGQSTGEFLLEQLIQKLMPQIEQKITEGLNKSGTNQFGSGGFR